MRAIGAKYAKQQTCTIQEKLVPGGGMSFPRLAEVFPCIMRLTVTVPMTEQSRITGKDFVSGKIKKKEQLFHADRI